MKRSEISEKAKAEQKNKKPRPSPIEGRCSFWLDNRQRYCHLQRTRGSEFCTAHTPTATRIPCPKDPHHFVEPADLEKHLKRCPGTRLSKSNSLPYFSKDLNSGEEEQEKEQQQQQEENIEVTIQKVKEVYPISEKEVPCPLEVLKCQKCLDNDPLCSVKHGTQHSSLIGHLLAENMLKVSDSPSALVELGAGKGRLSWLVSHCCPEGMQRKVLLVDRGRFRHAFEKPRQDENELFERALIDIKDLDLSHAPICENVNSIVCFGKHLCGSACDMSLRCILTWIDGKNKISSSSTTTSSLTPTLNDCECHIAIALCCFHRCEWKSYVGKSYLLKHGIDRNGFENLKTMTGWNTGERTEDGSPEKQQLGNKARLILAAGRLNFLIENGFTAKIVKYVDESISPENLLLLASYHKKIPVSITSTPISQAPSVSAIQK